MCRRAPHATLGGSGKRTAFTSCSVDKDHTLLEIIALIAFGFVVGGYGTLVGIGGGPLIVPMLATFYSYDTLTVVAISILVVFCNTLSGTIAYLFERRIDVVSGTKFGLAAIPGALFCVLVLQHIHINVFSFLFGFFLLLLAFYIFLHPLTVEFAGAKGFFWKARRARRNSLSSSRFTFGDEFISTPKFTPGEPVERVITDASGNVFVYQVNERLGIWLTATIGVFSTFLGIGGGLIQVPALVYVLSFPVHVATATSHYITAINAGFTLIPFLAAGIIPYKTALCIAVGAIGGAQIGAKLSNRVSGKNLLLLLVPVFILMGIKLMFYNFK